MPSPSSPSAGRLGCAVGLLVLIVVLGVLFVVPALERAVDPDARTAYLAELSRRAARAEALEPWWLALSRLAIATLATILVSVGAIFGAAAYAAWRYLPARGRAAAAVYRLQGGLPPALVHDAGDTLRVTLPEQRNPLAEVARAIYAGAETPGAPAVRLPAGPRLPVQAAAEPADRPPWLPLASALSVDPHDPHWLLIGGTGSGKSVAAYTILRRIADQLPAEFIILERDGVNWNAQATATDLRGYVDALRAIESERQRRVGLLRAADVDHIARLPEPPPYWVVLLEEAESVYSDLARLGRGEAQTFTLILRGLAAMGRKQGIMLVAVTQTGTSQVFDVPTRKNLGHRLLFRSEPAVGDFWGLPRSVGLSTLPTGTAYDLAHAGLVRFPPATRPQLPPARLALPEREPDAGAVPVQEPVPGADPLPAPAGPVRVPSAVGQDTPPNEAEQLLIYRRYRALGSLKAVERELYGQEGGVKFYWVRDAVRAQARRRGHILLSDEEEE